MALGRVVPWRDWEEWEQVRTGLFSANPSSRRSALDRVKAWEARGRLPLGAEITACLHELHISDQGYGAAVSAPCQPASEPESLLRLQYAMLVIRLVNGISDSSQKGRVAMSVANLAEDAGIPRILVDVRHDASHNELPSLALLRLASTAAVSWLSSAYWQRQADHLLSCRAHIRSLLQRYVELQRAAILKQATLGKAEEEDSLAEDAADVQAQTETYSGTVGQKQRREVMAEMWERVHAAADLLIGPLLDDGLLGVQQEASTSGKMSSEQVAAAVWEAVMQGLTGTWPRLRQLLLAAAIQRLCSTLPSSSIAASAGLLEKDSEGVLTQADALVQWVGKLLGVTRENGHKGGRQQKVGAKRRNSQADLDIAGLREQWRPSMAQLRSLLASCLSVLAQCPAGVEGVPDAQSRAVALRRVAGMLLQQLQSVQEEGKHVHADQFQRLLEVSTAGAAETGTASDQNMQNLSEALRTASARQKELMQTATAAAAGASRDSAKRTGHPVRWECYLPHTTPAGCMPTLDVAPCQYPWIIADAEAADAVTESLLHPAADAMPCVMGIGPALVDSTITKVHEGAAPFDDLEVHDYFSKFDAKDGEGASDPEVQADDGWTSDQIERIAADQIERIAAAVKVL